MNVRAVDYLSKEKSILDYLSKNGEPGLDVGFQCLSEFYTHRHSGITDWTGFPASGKTYFVLEILMTLSERFGQRNVLYVPDIGNYNEVWSKLFQMKTGKNFNGRYGNKATDMDIYQAQEWINQHFIILERTDIRKPIPPSDIWLFTCEYEDAFGKVNNCLIDSWKNMSHIYQNREDQYLDYILSYRNELSEKFNKHFHTIAHAAKTEMDENNDYVDEAGKKRKKRRIPDANDIKGGSSWFANGKNIISVDYPNKKSTEIDLYISKTKPEGVGKVGSVIGKIKLDLNRHRFYETSWGEKRFTFTTEKFKEPNFITPPKEKVEEEENCPF